VAPLATAMDEEVVDAEEDDVETEDDLGGLLLLISSSSSSEEWFPSLESSVSAEAAGRKLAPGGKYSADPSKSKALMAPTGVLAGLLELAEAAPLAPCSMASPSASAGEGEKGDVLLSPFHSCARERKISCGEKRSLKPA